MRQSFRKILYACLFIVILLAGIVFFVQNSQELEFNYVIGTITLPLSLLILLSLCAGAMLGMLAMVPLVLRQRRRMAGLVKQAQMAEKEINNLRVIPVKDRP
ncbi:MAG: LapA family protein [Gammaproteobacteria bacterium]